MKLWRRERPPSAADTAALQRLRLLNEQLAGAGGPAAADRAADNVRPTAESLAFGRAALPPRTLDPISVPRQQIAASPTPQPSAPAGSSGAGGGRHAARPLAWPRRLVGALLDRTPTGANGLTSTHVTVLALVGVGAVLLALWWLTGARPRPAPIAEAAIVEPVPGKEAEASGAEVVPDSDPGQSAGTAGAVEPTSPSTAPPAATVASAPAEVVVDVAGKVRRPGIVVLPAGARVADALEAAGGLRPAADTAGLNLARPLQDGEQVLVGLTAATPPAAAPPDPSATLGTPTLVNLNTATMEQLDTLPGVGPVTAQSILDWRAEHTAFSSVDELLEVDGIGDATLADLRDLVTV